VTPSTVHDDDDDDEAATNGTSGADDDDDSAASAQQQPKSTIQIKQFNNVNSNQQKAIKLKQQFKKSNQQNFILNKYIFIYLKYKSLKTLSTIKGHDDDKLTTNSHSINAHLL
jgi:hypothetical protein